MYPCSRLLSLYQQTFDCSQPPSQSIIVWCTHSVVAFFRNELQAELFALADRIDLDCIDDVVERHDQHCCILFLVLVQGQRLWPQHHPKLFPLPYSGFGLEHVNPSLTNHSFFVLFYRLYARCLTDIAWCKWSTSIGAIDGIHTGRWRQRVRLVFS